MAHKYFDFCDEIVRDFFNKTLKIYPSLELKKSGKPRFNLEFMPEPYIPLAHSDQHPNSDYLDWLHVLLANPGPGQEEQTKESIRLGKLRGVSEKQSYSQFAHMLFRNYKVLYRDRKGARNGLRHFEGAQTLADLCGGCYAGAVQIDSIPWHSQSLSKDELPLLILGDERTNQYTDLLRTYLEKRSVISVDGAGGSGHTSISDDNFFDRPWIKYKAKLIGMDIEKVRPQFSPIIVKPDGKITAAAMSVNVGGIPKVMYCVRGDNHLPGEDGRQKLAKLLARH